MALRINMCSMQWSPFIKTIEDHHSLSLTFHNIFIVEKMRIPLQVCCSGGYCNESLNPDSVEDIAKIHCESYEYKTTSIK